MTLKQYLYKILLFSVIIGTISGILYATLLSKFYLSVFPFLLLFFILVNTFTHWFVLQAGNKKPARFSAYFMGTISFKLIVYLLFLTAYVLIDKSNAMVFIITFFTLYLFYSVFETISLQKQFRK
jgi:hypothetical protein